jgi:hypothetical protein
VTARLDPRAFTIATVPKRFAKLGQDPVAPVLGNAVDIAGTLVRLEHARERALGRGKTSARRGGQRR